MKICVIGAGPSGLTTIKQLLDEGHEVFCFDRNDDIGGIWYRHQNDNDQMKVFDNMLISVSMKLMSFSDFIHQGERTFTDHRGYLEYLHAYVVEYDLRKNIAFNSTVEGIRWEGDSWVVTVMSDGERSQHTFAALAVCTGPFTTPNKNIPGLENYTGEVVHSCQYRNNRKFQDKKVLVIGLAESGADIVREVSDAASECTLAIRSRTFILPRLFRGRYSTDMMTFRAHHYEMWVRATKIPFPMKALWGENSISGLVFFVAALVYGLIGTAWLCLLKALGRENKDRVSGDTDNLGQPRHPNKMDMFTENTQEHVDAINEWNDKSHKGMGSWSQRAIFCKNASFIPNVVNGKIEVNDTGVRSFDGKRVQFNDGTAREFDAAVLCTGFVHDYSLLGDIRIEDNNIRNLYKHCIHPDYNGRLAVIGLVRPFSGGIPICSEMQARYFALLCSDKLRLPADLRAVIGREKEWEEAWTEFSPQHTEAVPSQIMFLDSLAKEIGCLMPVHKLIFQPRMLVKHWFYSFSQACYRLVGPHNMYNAARKELLSERLPADDISMVWSFSLFRLLPHQIHPKNLVSRT